MRNPLLTFFVALSITLGFSQENYSLSSESVLTVDGSSTLHDWTVTANTFGGSIVLEGNVFKKISFDVEVASISSTRGATMDKKTHNALKKDEHPKILFSAADIGFLDGEDQTISGKLTIAGVEKEVPIKASIKQSNGNIKITGTQKITLQDYNMEPPTAMFGSIVVGDDVFVNFDLVFAK